MKWGRSLCVWCGGCQRAEFSKETAVGKKLFLDLLVLVRRLLKRLPEGRRLNSPWSG